MQIGKYRIGFKGNSLFTTIVIAAIAIGVVVVGLILFGVTSHRVGQGLLALGVVVWAGIIGYGVNAQVVTHKPESFVRPELDQKQWNRVFDRRAS